MLMMPVNWTAYFASVLVAYAVGGLWYSSFLFGKVWMKEAGLTTESAGSPIQPMILAFVATLISAFVMGFAMIAVGAFSPFGGALTGLAIGVGFVATSVGVMTAFEKRSWKLGLINSGQYVVALTLMGAVQGWLR